VAARDGKKLRKGQDYSSKVAKWLGNRDREFRRRCGVWSFV